MDHSTLKYLPSHEWADIHGDICTVGITQYNFPRVIQLSLKFYF